LVSVNDFFHGFFLLLISPSMNNYKIKYHSSGLYKRIINIPKKLSLKS
jgi:hypothetical protein